MSNYFFRILSALLLGVAMLASCSGVNNTLKTISAKSDALGEDTKPILSLTPSKDAKGEQTAVFAGGCFWGVEGVFEHVKGVSHVRSGFAGGAAEKIGYAEAVKITFAPSKISYEQLLKIFFFVATRRNSTGNDQMSERNIVQQFFTQATSKNNLPKIILPN